MRWPRAVRTDRPVPAIGLTMRENWLPTQLQKNFLDLIQKRIVGSLSLTKA